jgi:hypothetical protein
MARVFGLTHRIARSAGEPRPVKDQATMAASVSATLIAELEGAVDRLSPQRCSRILQQVTCLFLAEARRLNEEQIAVFDDVFICLIEQADVHCLSLLSDNLSKISPAPPKTIRKLALHQDILIAGPMRSIQAEPPALQGKIQAAIVASARQAPAASVDYSSALARMVELNRKGGLNDRSVNRFAVEREYVEVAAALALLSGAPVDVIAPLTESAELDGLMAACKAARLSWSTTMTVIRYRPGCPMVTNRELEQAEGAFDALSLSVAQRTIRLW